MIFIIHCKIKNPFSGSFNTEGKKDTKTEQKKKVTIQSNDLIYFLNREIR
ncbi:MAG: hypothetical protein LBJ00_16170 [Planctomycetaceae bacterium]|jgi:hypothetical protein|nr:hypothetical protein [Planctomycetaceae bacterium]